jgi:hypothetical protein
MFKPYLTGEKKKGSSYSETLPCIEWEHTGSNRGPSACKADALNQLSYAPFLGLQR